MPPTSSNRSQLSRTGYGGSAYTHQGWLTDDQRFFLVNDEGDEQAFRHRTRTWIWDVSDLDAPVLLTYYDGPTSSIDHNLYVRGNLVYESNYRSGLRVLDATEIAQGALREVGFFDIYPSTTTPASTARGRRIRSSPAASVIVNGIEQGLFVVRPRAIPQGLPTGLSVTINGPATAAPGEDVVIRRQRRQPWTRAPVRDTRDRDAAVGRVAAVGSPVAGGVLDERGGHVRARKPRTWCGSVHRRHDTRDDRRRCVQQCDCERQLG